jgi:hypothetical protein
VSFRALAVDRVGYPSLNLVKAWLC